jgi:hypothetical protein
MKKMDERNLKIILGLVTKGETVTARQALDMLIDYKLQRGDSMMYVPNVNRMCSVLRWAKEFQRMPSEATKSHVRFVRAY